MPQRYSSTERIPSEVVALAPDPKFIPESGMEIVGNALLKLSADLQASKDARATAEGISQYNAMVDEYQDSLANKDPNKDDFVEGFRNLQTNIGRIYEGKSKRVRDKLQNNFTVLNQRNEAQIARYAIDRNSQLTKQELPNQLELFASKGQREQAMEYIDGLGGVLTPREQDSAIAYYNTRSAKMVADAAVNNFEQQAIGEYTKAEATTPGSGVEAASTWAVNNMADLSRSGLSLEDQKSAIADITSIVKQRDSHATKAKEALIDKTTLSYYSSAWNGELVDIKQLNIDAGNGLVPVTDRNNIVKIAENITRPNTPSALGEMDRVTLQLGDGRISKQATVKKLQELSPKLSNETIAEYTQEIEKEFNISQDAAVSEAAKFARTQIVNISETVFDQLAELIVREKEIGKKEDLQFELKSKKQQWKEQNLELHRYNLAMRKYMKYNPQASPDMILEEGMRKVFSEFSTVSTTTSQAELNKTATKEAAKQPKPKFESGPQTKESFVESFNGLIRSGNKDNAKSYYDKYITRFPD